MGDVEYRSGGVRQQGGKTDQADAFLYLDTHVSIGIPLSTAIRNFQNSFGFDDDTWSYETIRREYNRHGYRKTVENTTILDFINRIILGKLSEFGTISLQGKMAYESNAL